MNIFKLIGMVVLIAGVIFVNTSIYTVDEKQQALVLRFGEAVAAVHSVNEPAGIAYYDPEPGLHFKLPWEEVITFDRRNLEFDMRPAEILASDQERLIVDAFLRYRIVDPLLFFQTVRSEDGAQQRLSPIMQDSLRGVIASIESNEVVSGERAALMVLVRDAVKGQVDAQQLGLEVIDVRILRADFPPQIADSVMQRMISERVQEATGHRAGGEERARQIRAAADREAQVLVAEATADAERIRGAGDAQRNALYAAAYGRDIEFFTFYRSMLAYETAIQAGTPIVIPADSEFFEYFRSQDGNQ